MKARWLAASAALLASATALGLVLRALHTHPSDGLALKVERENAETTEALVGVTEIAWGVAMCAERSGVVPPSTAPVPAEMRAVAGVMYQSRRSEWSDPAFACLGFHLRRPQRFQYHWARADDRLSGAVVADADFDGDGTVDHEVRLQVRCARVDAGVRCDVDPMPTEAFAPATGPRWH